MAFAMLIVALRCPAVGPGVGQPYVVNHRPGVARRSHGKTVMEALLGFQITFWDYVTFASLSVIVMSTLALAVFILGLPGRIAIARNHPEADAIYLMGWIGFLAIVPWIQALIWAFKPTDVIDIRHMPAARQRETEEMIARLSGKATPPHEPPAAHPGGNPTP
jgi:Protein of unknown function (DUF3302)